jgi:hypothetical protein
MFILASLLTPLDLNRLSPAEALTVHGMPVVASVLVANPPDAQFGLTYFGDDTGFVPKTVYLPGEHDIREGAAVVWSRTDRPAKMVVEFATAADFRRSRRTEPVAATPETDFTAKALVSGLPPGQTIYYRVSHVTMPGSLRRPPGGRVNRMQRARLDLGNQMADRPPALLDLGCHTGAAHPGPTPDSVSVRGGTPWAPPAPPP